MSKKCIIANCDQMCSERSRFDICERCRATITRWLKRSASAILARRKNLERYQDRFDQTGRYKKEAGK